MANGRPIEYTIAADTKNFERGVKKAEKSLDGMDEKTRKSAHEIDEGLGDAADHGATASSQLAGAIGDIGGALAQQGIISQGTADAMDGLSATIMGATGVFDLANLAFETFKATTVGAKIATAAQTVATWAQVAAQRALTIAMAAGPWILLVAAIAAVVVVIVLIVKHWDTVKKVMSNLWGWIKGVFIAGWHTLKSAVSSVVSGIKNVAVSVFNTLLKWFKRYTLPGIILSHWNSIKRFTSSAFQAVKGFIQRPISAVVGWVSGRVSSIVGAFRGIRRRISGAFSGMFDGLKSAFRSAVNWLIGRWNSFHLTLGGGSVLGMSIPSVTLSTPNIPYLANGGIIRGGRGGTLAVIGEKSYDEAVVPLDGREIPGAGNQTIINVTVQAPVGSSSADIGRVIQRHLDAYRRKGGKAFA